MTNGNFIFPMLLFPSKFDWCDCRTNLLKDERTNTPADKDRKTNDWKRTPLTGRDRRQQNRKSTKPCRPPSWKWPSAPSCLRMTSRLRATSLMTTLPLEPLTYRGRRRHRLRKKHRAEAMVPRKRRCRWSQSSRMIHRDFLTGKCSKLLIEHCSILSFSWRH